MTEDRLTFETLPAAVGRVVRCEPFVLGAEDSEMFHRATWLDRAYPDDIPEFPDTLVEGFWLLAMVDAVARLADSSDGSVWGLNYGLDKVRFIGPVHLGDRVVPTFEVIEVVPKDIGYKLLRRCIFQVEGSDTPAMVADWWSFVLPRGAVEEGRRQTAE